MATVLVDFLWRFTYVGLFVVLFGTGLGLPVPEEVPLILAGVLAQRGVVRLHLVLPVCLTGVLAADLLLYAIGRRWGVRILAWRSVRSFVTPERLERLTQAYQRWGLGVVALARLVVGLRAAAFLTAGVARVPLPRFLAVDAAASLVSVPLAIGIGYVLADRFDEALVQARRVQMQVGMGVLALLAIVFLWLRHRRRS